MSLIPPCAATSDSGTGIPMTSPGATSAVGALPPMADGWWSGLSLVVGLIGLLVLALGIGLQVGGPLADASVIADQIALVANRSQVVLQQSAQAALQTREAVTQARVAYGAFSREIAPSLGQGLGSVMTTSQRFGETLTTVSGYLDVPLPCGLDWKGWTTIPGLLYAHPLRPAAEALASGGQDFTALAQGLQATQVVLRSQDAASERVTPALAEVELLLGDLGQSHLPALAQAVAEISTGATRTATGITSLGVVVCLIGLGFIATAALGWRLGRQLAGLARAHHVAA